MYFRLLNVAKLYGSKSFVHKCPNSSNSNSMSVIIISNFIYKINVPVGLLCCFPTCQLFVNEIMFHYRYEVLNAVTTDTPTNPKQVK